MRPTTYLLSSVLDSTIDRWSSGESKLAGSIEFALNCWLTVPKETKNKLNNVFAPAKEAASTVNAGVLSGGFEDSILNAAREFWDAQECPAPTITDETVSLGSRRFWGPTNAAAMANGLDDHLLLAVRDFWIMQATSTKEGIRDSVCIAFKEFWQTQDVALIAAQEFRQRVTTTSQDDAAWAIGEYLEMWKVSVGGITQEDSFQKCCKGMAEALARKHFDLETAAKLRERVHLEEMDRLHRALYDAKGQREELARANAQLISTQRDLTVKLAKATVQLEVVDEMIGHNVELEWANDELNRKLGSASEQLRANCSLQRENVELASSNDELRRIVLSMEKAGERHFDETRRLKNTIDTLQRANPISSPRGSTRSASRPARRRRSVSKRHMLSLSETSLTAPHSAGVLCANA